MIRAALDGTHILVTADAESAEIAATLPGIRRTAKMAPCTWHMPLSAESIDQLRGAGARASPELIAEAKRLLATRRYVEAQKQTAHVEPLRPLPLKPGVQLYTHQIKMANIALALMGYSENGIHRDAGSAAFFAEMGTGKSSVTVATIGRLFLDGKVSRALVVAPSSVCAVWPHEYSKFAGFPYRIAVLLGERDKRLAALKALQALTLPHDAPEPLRVAVINYESVRLLEAELAAYGADMIIADESQRIKTPTAQQSKAMHRLGDRTKYKLILTGTPITQDTRDVWSQYRFLDPSIFGGSYYTFVKHYATMGGYGQHQYLGPRNLPELTRKAHSIAFRVQKSECLDLPEKLFEDRIVELEPNAQALYRRIQKESYAALESGGEVTASIVLTRLLRLQQIAGGFLTDDDGVTIPVSTAKLEAALDIVQTLCLDEGQKLVIFARFRAEVQAIRARVDALLQPAGLCHVAIWGDVPIIKRGEIVTQFQDDPNTRVMVAQIDAAAEGITLTAAHTTLYYSLTWNLAKYMQSQDRTHRIGQDHGTLYIHLIAPGTIDAKIMAALKKKQSLAHSVVDNWRLLLTEDMKGADSQ
ncbi:DEAD/DEAH box helicase [Eubacteriales bacterium OttesenSCG-928-N13]|nr:DEAD/DEAH box helicase [Eubacteriales bacterium OttesenSCG-928-N13]